jgi:hypothetical protein
MADERDRRRIHRHQVELPVEWGDGSGVTRDVSIDGVFFCADRAPATEGEIVFDVLVDGAFAQIPARFECRGEIVRVEQLEGKVGVAVRVVSIDFKGADNRWGSRGERYDH